MLSPANHIPLNLKVLQLFPSLFRLRTDRCHLRLCCIGNLTLRLLGGGVFRELLGEWNEFRGSWKVFSEWLGYIKAL